MQPVAALRCGPEAPRSWSRAREEAHATMATHEDPFLNLPLSELPSPQRSGTLTLSGNPPIRWVAFGDGATLICCNGAFTSSLFWMRTAQVLGGHHRVVLWDYPGHGASGLGQPVDDVSIPTLARYVDRIRAELRASQVVLLGHSMGCQVALEARNLFPDRVAGLVLVAPTAGRLRDWRLYGLPMPLVLRLLAAGGRLTRPGDPTPIGRLMKSNAVCRAVLRLHLMHPRLIDPRQLDAYVDHIVALNPGVVVRIVAEADRHDVLRIVSAAQVPTLIVAGDRDPMVSYTFSERLGAAMPDARVRPVIGATHALPIEFPAFMGRYIEDYLVEIGVRKAESSASTRLNPTECLCTLLMDLFTQEELLLWARAGPAGEEILRNIPIFGSFATLASATVDAHRARGLLDQEFFERLMRVRPRREEEIYLVARSFGIGAWPNSTEPP